MPLFTYPPAPFTLEAPDVAVMTSALTALTSGSAYFNAIILYTPVTVTQMRCDITAASPTGNVDMGIYDSTGTNGQPNNLLGHTGAIAAVTGVFTQNLTSNLLLSPGRYWLAYLGTQATDQPGVRQALGSGGIGVVMKTSASGLSVLPSTAGTVANTFNRVGIIALLSGSWS
jgi:hypothetical protein